MGTYWTVDLGATSGRVISARLDSGRITMHEEGRFTNRPSERNGRLCWDIDHLWGETLAALTNAAEGAHATGHLPAAIAVDSWGVDFALVNAAGDLAADVRHYRSATPVARTGLQDIVSDRDLFGRTGVAPMDINTVYRIPDAIAELNGTQRDITVLSIADLWTYRLSGTRAAELTMAGTTSLLRARSHRWDAELLDLVGIDPRVLAPIAPTGTLAGALLRDVADRIGLPPEVAVAHTASHDTAAAIAAIAGPDRVAFISCGSWALVGVETDRPILSDAAYSRGFTNEIGGGGQILFMRNLTGLWLLEQALRAWRAEDPSLSLTSLLAEAEVLEGRVAEVDVGSELLQHSVNVEADIQSMCRDSGQSAPRSAPEMVRCILQSLAEGFRQVLEDCEHLAGIVIEEVYMVGGGTRNALLCQLVADVCARPVLVGLAEASSLGNALVQARACGEIKSDAHTRDLVRTSYPPVRYLPRRQPDRNQIERERSSRR